MIKSVVTHTRGWVSQKVVISSVRTFWIISRWNFTIQTMTYLTKTASHVTETSQNKQVSSKRPPLPQNRFSVWFIKSSSHHSYPKKWQIWFNWSDAFLLSEIISNFTLLLKAHRQVSKKRSLKSIIYVIKHANFQLYRVHPDVVDRTIYDKFTNKQ